MKQVFGPVPSRRLGQSLRIDPLPLKTCNWNCAYCRLGRGLPLTNRRKDFYSPDEIVFQECGEALQPRTAGEIDRVNFGGALWHPFFGMPRQGTIPIRPIARSRLPEAEADFLKHAVTLMPLDEDEEM